MRELASSSWAPAVYPYKALMAIGFTLLLLQGVARLIQDFSALRSND
jgi:TRAP-type mannitol/chloroaromatic compound transport system permease small subunit